MSTTPSRTDLITVLICSYNHADYLGAAIHSVLRQSLQPARILVLDDGSTDHTAKVAAEFTWDIEYHCLPHGGLVAARTKGLELVETPWIAILDADNLFEPGYLATMLDVILAYQDDPLFAVAIPSRRYFGYQNRFEKIPEFSESLLKQRNLVDSNSVYRTAAAREIGYDPALFAGLEDYDHAIGLTRAGYRCRSVPQAVISYRTHANSMTSLLRSLGTRRKMRHLIAKKHQAWFTEEEREQFDAQTRNQHFLGLIHSRTPASSFFFRLRSVIAFAAEDWRHAEFFRQCFYWLFPKSYFKKHTPISEVFFLYRDTPARREQLHNGQSRNKNTDLPRDLLCGADQVERSGISTYSNLHLSRSRMNFEMIWDRFDRWYAPRAGIGLGDEPIVRAFLWQIRRAYVLVTCSDTVGLPALRLKKKGAFQISVLYVSVGLPERIMQVAKLNKKRADRYRELLLEASAIVAYGEAESRWLKEWLGDTFPIHFIPFGVDTNDYKPEEKPNPTSEADVLTVGSDPQRDFASLLQVATSLPQVRFHIIASRTHQKKLSDTPSNVKVSFDLPREKYREALAQAKLVALPVKENTYSGATTTLLQAMAMEKPVIVSNTGAIRNGYGLIDGKNCFLIAPGLQTEWKQRIEELLQSPALRHEIGKNARKHVQTHLNWDQHTARITKVIHQLKDEATCR